MLCIGNSNSKSKALIVLRYLFFHEAYADMWILNKLFHITFINSTFISSLNFKKIKADLEGFEPPISGSEVLCHSRLDHRPIKINHLFSFSMSSTSAKISSIDSPSS